MKDIFFVLVLLLIVFSAVLYIVKKKKKGIKCIGCPYIEKCTSKNSCLYR